MPSKRLAQGTQACLQTLVTIDPGQPKTEEGNMQAFLDLRRTLGIIVVFFCRYSVAPFRFRVRFQLSLILQTDANAKKEAVYIRGKGEIVVKTICEISEFWN